MKVDARTCDGCKNGPFFADEMVEVTSRYRGARVGTVKQDLCISCAEGNAPKDALSLPGGDDSKDEVPTP